MMPSINKDWFPGKASANNFGWDPLSPQNSDANIWPRIHLGCDFWPIDDNVMEHIPHTIISGKLELIIDNDGNSVLRQFAGDIEVRYYHFRKEEFFQEMKDALDNHTVLEAGTEIGPCGDVGVSHGRHVHIAIVAADSVDLSPILGQGWDEDRTDDLAARYGKVFLEKAHAPNRKIIRMNDLMVYRIDGMTGKRAYYINPEILVG